MHFPWNSEPAGALRSRLCKGPFKPFGKAGGSEANLITVSKRVKAALDAIGVCARRAYAQDWSEFPAIVWRESANSVYAQADAEEYLAELEYEIGVYAFSQEETEALSERIDSVLSGIALKRSYSAELFESDTRLHHRVLKYRGCADASGNIYQ